MDNTFEFVAEMVFEKQLRISAVCAYSSTELDHINTWSMWKNENPFPLPKQIP